MRFKDKIALSFVFVTFLFSMSFVLGNNLTDLGDLDGNCIVDLEDLKLYDLNYGIYRYKIEQILNSSGISGKVICSDANPQPNLSAGDLDGNCIVDLEDLKLYDLNYGKYKKEILSVLDKFGINGTEVMMSLELVTPLNGSIYDFGSSIIFGFNTTNANICNSSQTTSCTLYVNGTNKSDFLIFTNSSALQTVNLSNFDSGFYSWNVNCLDSRNNSIISGNWNFLVNSSPPIVETEQILAPSGGSGGGCVPDSDYDWNCGEWSECVDGTQTRNCNERNNCGNSYGRPEISQSCVSGEEIGEETPVEVETEEEPQGFLPGITGAVVGTLGTVGTTIVSIFLVLILGGFGIVMFRRRKK